MDIAREILKDLDLPQGDRHDLPSSTARFPDGTRYRIEIPSVEGLTALHAVIDAEGLDVPLHRASQGSGIMLLTDAEIAAMAELGRSHGIETSLFVGPCVPWEGTGQALTPDGKVVGWWQTGLDQLVYAFGDIERAIALGIRSVLVADEGLLWLVNQARHRGVLPRDLVVKASAFLGVANPCGITLLVDQGPDAINVASAISLRSRLAAPWSGHLDLDRSLYREPRRAGRLHALRRDPGDRSSCRAGLPQVRAPQRTEYLPERRPSRAGRGADHARARRTRAPWPGRADALPTRCRHAAPGAAGLALPDLAPRPLSAPLDERRYAPVD